MKLLGHSSGVVGVACASATVFAVALLAGAERAVAQTPLGSAFTYQGELTDGGIPVPGPVDLTFRLYDAATLGNLIGTDTVLGLPTDGRFTVTLDYGVGAFNGDRRWLEIDVGLTTLSPRQEITVAPYALQTRGLFVNNLLNVGIGTTSPAQKLHVADGNILVTGSSPRIGLAASNNSSATIVGLNDGSFGSQFSFFTNTPGTGVGIERIRVTGSGNVGIGTPSPGFPLQMGSGAHVTVGGVWTNASSVALKENFAPVEPREILARVADLPIRRWNYKAEDDGIKHIGPTAEDFHAAFAVGQDDAHIGTVDADGVALAAIQGLNQLIREKDSEIQELRGQVRFMADRLAALEALVDQLVSPSDGGAE